MTLVIMAAGMGSRFGGLKQIEKVDDNDHFIIDYSIYDAIKAGYDKVVFIIKKENYEIFKETIGSRVENKIKVEYVFQELDKLPEGYNVPEGRVKPWGTAHAILCCKDVVNEPFTIINADDFYGRDAYLKSAEFIKESNENEYAMVGYNVENTITDNGSVKRGVCEEENGYLTKLIESSIEKENNKYIASPLNGNPSFEVNKDTTVSMNMFTFKPIIFKCLEENFPLFLDKNKDNLLKCEYLIPDMVFKQIENNEVKVKVLKTTSKWLGVTYKEDKPYVVEKIKELIENNEYTSKLWD